MPSASNYLSSCPPGRSGPRANDGSCEVLTARGWGDWLYVLTSSPALLPPDLLPHGRQPLGCAPHRPLPRRQDIPGVVVGPGLGCCNLEALKTLRFT